MFTVGRISIISRGLDLGWMIKSAFLNSNVSKVQTIGASKGSLLPPYAKIQIILPQLHCSFAKERFFAILNDFLIKIP